MLEFLVNINPYHKKEARKIVKQLQKSGVIPQGADVYVGADSTMEITNPPEVRVEEIFRDESGAISTARITSKP